jgi:hypothetical protein
VLLSLFVVWGCCGRCLRRLSGLRRGLLALFPERRAEQIEPIRAAVTAIVAEPERDAAGRIVRLRTARPSFTPREIAQLFQPYVSQRFLDQFKTVAPLAAYLVLFQLLVLRQLVQDSWLITGGLLAVILGLMFFMEGLKKGGNWVYHCVKPE